MNVWMTLCEHGIVSPTRLLHFHGAKAAMNHTTPEATFTDGIYDEGVWGAPVLCFLVYVAEGGI